MDEMEHYTLLIGAVLNEIDPQGLGVRESEDAVYDLAAVLNACYNFGMSAEDAALMVLSSEYYPL